MNMEYKQSYCNYCKKRIRSEKQVPSYMMHILLIVLTCGLWLIMCMFPILQSAANRFHCPICGGRDIVHKRMWNNLPS